MCCCIRQMKTSHRQSEKDAISKIFGVTQRQPRRNKLVQLFEFAFLLLHLEVIYQIRDVVVVIICTCARAGRLLLLDVLVGLGELPERCQGVGTELVEDARYELCEILDGACAIDRECVCRYGGVDWK